MQNEQRTWTELKATRPFRHGFDVFSFFTNLTFVCLVSPLKWAPNKRRYLLPTIFSLEKKLHYHSTSRLSGHPLSKHRTLAFFDIGQSPWDMSPCFNLLHLLVLTISPFSTPPYTPRYLALNLAFEKSDEIINLFRVSHLIAHSESVTIWRKARDIIITKRLEQRHAHLVRLSLVWFSNTTFRL